MRISDWSSDVCSSDLLNVRLLPTDFIFPRQRAANPPVAALIMDGIDPQFRLALLVEYLEQPPLPDQMGAEELRDEAFVPVIGPDVLQHLHRVARSGAFGEPFPVLLRRFATDALYVGHDAES